MKAKENTKSTSETVKEIKKKSSQLKEEIDRDYVLEGSRAVIDAFDRKADIPDD